MLETEDIQHILLTRTPALTGRYEFLSFRNAAGGRDWLSAIREKAQSAAEVMASVETDKRWVTVAFTWSGQLAAIAIAARMRVNDLAHIPLSFPTYAGILARVAASAKRELNLKVSWQAHARCSLLGVNSEGTKGIREQP